MSAGLRLPAAGGIRRQARPTAAAGARVPPNPLARFGVPYGRCVKTPACSDRSGRPPSVAPWPASRHPGKKTRECKAQRFANRASSLRRVLLVGPVPPLFEPLSPGLVQPPAALTVRGK